MFVLPVQIHPTFPLDAAKIQQFKDATVWQSPRLLILKTLAELARPMCQHDGDGIANRLVARWQQLDDQLTAAVIRKLIDDSNLEQDATIRSMVRSLECAGKTQYSSSLSKLLRLKQHIERDLHRDKKLTPRTSEIEQLVDSIAQEVCNEIHVVGNLDDEIANVLTCGDQERLECLSERMKVIHSRILRAYATLAETAEQLSKIQPPLEPTASADEGSMLDRLIENLREENEVSRAVNDRMRSELPTLDEL